MPTSYYFARRRPGWTTSARGRGWRWRTRWTPSPSAASRSASSPSPRYSWPPESFQSIPQVQLTPGKSSAQLFQKKICLSKTADTNIMAYNFFHHILDLQSRFWSGFWPRLGYGSSTVCTRSLDPFYVVGYHIDLNIKHETRSGNGYGISVFHLLCVQCTLYTVHCTLYSVADT